MADAAPTVSRADRTQVVIVGAGHNGLVAACYLARAGLQVLVLEQAERAGGGSRTDETVPGYRFNTHSAAHNIINMTDIGEELGLAEVGLEYLAMDPFAVAVFDDGRIVRFHRDIERTVDELRAVSAQEADAYAAFMRKAVPLIEWSMTGIEAGASTRRVAAALPGRLRSAGTALARFGGSQRLIRELLAPYDRLLRESLPSDRLRAPVAAFAAHAGASPIDGGSALFGYWQAAYHLFGQWHARGGAQGLIDALLRRADRLGVQVRTGARVTRIAQQNGTVQGVELASGERLPAQVVMTAMDPRTALLDLLDPPLTGSRARDLSSTHRGNAVQCVVHVAVDRLPAYPGALPGDYTGLQSFVDSLDDLAAGFARAEAKLLPLDPVPTYAFTPSAMDASLAPTGHHTVYLACPCAPFDVEGGWERHAEAFGERMIATIAERAPGFRESIQGVAIRTPELMAAELAWPGAHPMHLDITLDQLAWMRPTLELAGHTSGVRGLFITGSGTSPVGGVAGSPGRAAAKAILRAHGAPRAAASNG